MIKCGTCPAAAVIREPDGTYTCGVCAMNRIKEGKGVRNGGTTRYFKQLDTHGRQGAKSDQFRTKDPTDLWV